MGTNYYYLDEFQDEVHIGKSSGGWRFHFAYNSFKKPDEWKSELVGKNIFDEYGEEIFYDDFLRIVDEKQLEMTNEEVIRYYKKNYPKNIDKHFYPIIINDYEFYRGEFC